MNSDRTQKISSRGEARVLWLCCRVWSSGHMTCAAPHLRDPYDIDRLRRILVDVGLDPALANAGFRAQHPFPVAWNLAALGFRVTATKYLPTKKGLERGFLEKATTHPGMLWGRQRKFSPPCWSILTGEENGVVVLDFDGQAGLADLARLERQLGSIPPTWRAKSGRPDGGLHIYPLTICMPRKRR